MIKFFKYPGSKHDFLGTILPIIKNNIKEDTIFIEPFLGSGSVILNVDCSIRLASELNSKIYLFYDTVKKVSYNEFKTFYDNINLEFGNIGKNKESYYNARNTLNERYWNTNTLEEGMYLLIMQQSCLNSLYRIGPNGFNQSFGNRGGTFSFDEIDYQLLQKSIKGIDIINDTYLTLFEKYKDNKNVIWFLDPPYTEGGEVGYVKGFDHNYFIEKVKELKGKILYTNLYREEDYTQLNNSNLQLYKLRDMLNISPNRLEAFTSKIEVCYFINN